MDVAKTWTLPLTNRPIIHGPMWLIPGRVVLRPNRCQLERHRDANQARFVHAHAVLGGGLIRQHKWKHLRGWIISHCASFISAKQRQTGVIKVKYQTRFWEKCFHSSLSWEPNDSQHMYSNHFYFFPVWFAIPPSPIANCMLTWTASDMNMCTYINKCVSLSSIQLLIPLWGLKPATGPTCCRLFTYHIYIPK